MFTLVNLKVTMTIESYADESHNFMKNQKIIQLPAKLSQGLLLRLGAFMASYVHSGEFKSHHYTTQQCDNVAW